MNGRPTYKLVFQSRSGRPEDPWLGPDICEYLREEAAHGLSAAVLCPVGFICDHVEVLYDLDIEAAGVDADRPPARPRLGSDDHPRSIDHIADAVVWTSIVPTTALNGGNSMMRVAAVAIGLRGTGKVQWTSGRPFRACLGRGGRNQPYVLDHGGAKAPPCEREQGAMKGLTAVAGIKVGHHTLAERPTGCTVIVAEAGAVAGVDVRGSAPGTRETNILNPIDTVQQVHATVLSGRSITASTPPPESCGISRKRTSASPSAAV